MRGRFAARAISGISPTCPPRASLSRPRLARRKPPKSCRPPTHRPGGTPSRSPPKHRRPPTCRHPPTSYSGAGRGPVTDPSPHTASSTLCSTRTRRGRHPRGLKRTSAAVPCVCCRHRAPDAAVSCRWGNASQKPKSGPSGPIDIERTQGQKRRLTATVPGTPNGTVARAQSPVRRADADEATQERRQEKGRPLPAFGSNQPVAIGSLALVRRIDRPNKRARRDSRATQPLQWILRNAALRAHLQTDQPPAVKVNPRPKCTHFLRVRQSHEIDTKVRSSLRTSPPTPVLGPTTPADFRPSWLPHQSHNLRPGHLYLPKTHRRRNFKTTAINLQNIP